MKNLDDPSWAIQLQCPQCAAPVTLEEADRILSCAYCRVRLLLSYPGYPRYYLDPYQDPQPAHEFIYLPYWRFKGIAFASLQSGLEARAVDATFLAAKIPFLPITLGLQARAFKLRFFSLQKKGKFIKPQIQSEYFFNSLREGQDPFLESEGAPSSYHQSLIGESVSLVYAPIFLKEGLVYDGLGNRLLEKAGRSDVEKLPAHNLEEPWQVEFIPVLCPYCGADLQGERDTQVLLCRNCDRVWEFFQGGLKKADFGIMEVEEKQSPYFIPFWRIKGRIDGWPGQVHPQRYL